MFDALKKLFTPQVVVAADADRAVHGGAVLVDLRRDHEWRAGHAPHAIHLPLQQLRRHLDELPRDRPLITVCRSGHRSAAAALLLTRRRFQTASLTGGMASWQAAGLPIVDDDGAPGRVV